MKIIDSIEHTNISNNLMMRKSYCSCANIWAQLSVSCLVSRLVKFVSIDCESLYVLFGLMDGAVIVTIFSFMLY